MASRHSCTRHPLHQHLHGLWSWHAALFNSWVKSLFLISSDIRAVLKEMFGLYPAVAWSWPHLFKKGQSLIKCMLLNLESVLVSLWLIILQVLIDLFHSYGIRSPIFKQLLVILHLLDIFIWLSFDILINNEALHILQAICMASSFLQMWELWPGYQEMLQVLPGAFRRFLGGTQPGHQKYWLCWALPWMHCRLLQAAHFLSESWVYNPNLSWPMTLCPVFPTHACEYWPWSSWVIPLNYWSDWLLPNLTMPLVSPQPLDYSALHKLVGS